MVAGTHTARGAKQSKSALFPAVLLVLAGCATEVVGDDVTANSAALGDAATAPVSAAAATGPAEHAHAPSDAPQLVYAVRKADFVGAVTVRKTTGRDGTTGRAQTPAIWTDVELTLDHAVKDSRGVAASGRFTLSFLGGRVGTREMHVDHLPTFEPGEQLILIAKSDEKPCPTFAGEFGVLRVRDGKVFTSFGHPVVAITDQGYEVRTPREMMPTAPAPVALGSARGQLVMPEVGDEGDAILVDEALASLDVLVEAGQ